MCKCGFCVKLGLCKFGACVNLFFYESLDITNIFRLIFRETSSIAATKFGYFLRGKLATTNVIIFIRLS